MAHMKFVHDQQPLGVRRLQQSNITDDTLALCPCCTAREENQIHSMRCDQNQGRVTGWRQFRKDSLTKADVHPFWHCLVEGIEHWTAAQECQYVPAINSYSPHLRESISEAVTSQNAMGWDNALRGFLSRKWRDLASLDMHNPLVYSEDKANARLRKAMSCLYDYSRAMWEHRNEMLHTKDNTALAASIRSTSHAEIKFYHSRPHLLQFDDRHLCDRSLTKLLDGSLSTQRRWLRMVKKSTEISSRHGITQTTMTSFFAKKS
jgi:hypothetical protein